MKKRLISLLMVFTMLVGLLSMTGCGEETQTGDVLGTESTEEMLTKEQWIIGLGSVFGMNEYTSDELYFTDVPENAEVYPFLQSCAEWGIFEKTGIDFKPQTLITREEAIKNAVMAAEVLEHITEGNVFDECIPYALKAGIIETDYEEYLSENITYAEGQEILDWALAEYQNREFVEYSNVEMKEDVADLTQSGVIVTEDYGTVIVADDTVEELKKGDVFIAPGTVEFPYGVARKVVSVSYDEAGNQVVVTEQPKLEDLYDELDFAVRAVPELDDVVVYEGVTVASVGKDNVVNVGSSVVGNATNTILHEGNKSGNMSPLAKGETFKFQVNLKDGKIKLNKDWETSFGKFSLDLKEKGGDEKAKDKFEKSTVKYQGASDGTKTIDKIEKKFEGGYEITGEIKLENFYVDVQVEPEKVLGVIVGVKDVEIETSCKITNSLKIKGELKKSLTISTFHIQTPAPGVTVKVELVLFVGASGELELKVVTSSVTNITYADGKIKKTSNASSTMGEFAAGIEIEAGAELKASPCVMGIEIIDVSVEASGKINFSSKIGTEIRVEIADGKRDTIVEYYWNLTGKYTVPIITLKVGYGKDSLIQVGASWELVGENGLIKVKEKEMFNEIIFLGGEIQMSEPLEETETEELVTETETEKEEVTTETEISSEDGILGKSENIEIDVFSITLNEGETATINVLALPSGYEMSDLQWSTDNSTVISVSSGIVTAKASGVAQVIVSTSDGEYQVFCAVIVDEAGAVEFTPL